MEKEGDIVREKSKLSNINELVKMKSKHANSKIKFLLREIKNTIKYLQSLLTFSYAFCFWIFSKVIGSFIKVCCLI